MMAQEAELSALDPSVVGYPRTSQPVRAHSFSSLGYILFSSLLGIQEMNKIRINSKVK